MKVGSDNLLMINVYIVYDCMVGNCCIFVNNVMLVGYVLVDDFVIIGGMIVVYQFCIIGVYVMVGGCFGVVQDVFFYVIVQGNYVMLFGVNIEGLKCCGFSCEVIIVICNVYKLIYCSGKMFDEVKLEIVELVETYLEVKVFIDFFVCLMCGLIC